MRLEDLNTSQRAALDIYLSVTDESDIEKALDKLEAFGYDVEKALHAHYEDEANTTRVSSDTNEESTSSTPLNTQNHPRRSTSRPNQGSFSWFSFISWPFSALLTLLFKLLSLNGTLFNYRLLTGSSEEIPTTRGNSPKPFASQFEDAYGTTHPDFLDMSYSQVIDKAKRELKYLLVFLQCDEHEDNDEFCRKILTSSTLIEFLKEKNILVWGANVRYSEGFQVSVTLEANTYPFLGLVALKPRTTEHGGNIMAVLERIEGLISVSEITTRIQRQMDRLEPELIVLRQERAEQEQARIIREQQDSAYQMSLLADQEKARRLALQKEEQENLERQKLIETEKVALKAKLRSLYIQKLRNKIPEEPAKGTPNVANFSLRLENGERVIRRFRSTDTIKDIYNFVQTLLPDEEEVPTTSKSEAITALPSDYQHKFNFKLLTPFPRKEFLPSEAELGQNKDLWPGVNLIVEWYDEE